MKSSDFSTNAELSIHRVELSQVGLLSGSSYILDNFSFFFLFGSKIFVLVNYRFRYDSRGGSVRPLPRVFFNICM